MRTIEKLIGILENYVENDQIKAEDNFKSDLCLSSFDIVCIMSDIEAEFGFELNVADFVNNKTVGAISEFIDANL